MEPIDPLSQERLAVSEAVAESLNRTTMLKNSEAARGRKPRQVPTVRLDDYHSIKLDSDIVLAIEDMWQASGNPDFREWLEKFLNDAARGQLGI